MNERRNFFRTAGAVALGAAAVSRVGAASLPEAVTQSSPTTLPPAPPPNGRPFNPVVTLNGWSLPWRMNNGVKEFHLVVEPVVREFSPGMKVNMWGFNGSSPGPTIEAVEGDHVRIFVTNKLPEHTTVHWHGVLVPSGMDGVGGLTQPQIKPGETYVYEFTLRQHGSFMYHPHADEMVQMAMGMMGMFVIHPRGGDDPPIDRDFAIMLHEWRIDVGASRPNPNEMTDFNVLTMNARVFPATEPLLEGLRGAAHELLATLVARPDHGLRRQRLIQSADGLQARSLRHTEEWAGLVSEHVEGFARDYALTLRHWAKRLDERLDDARRLAGPQRTRVWRLYLRGARLGFETGHTAVYQVLARKPN